MTMREIRRAWTRQPQGATGIDWRNPLSRDLVFAYDGAQPALDATGTVPMAITSSAVTTRACEYGLATNYTGSQAALSCASASGFDGLGNATENTFDILVRFNTANPTCKLFSQWDGGETQRWTVEFSSGTLIWVAGDKTSHGANRSRFDLNSAVTAAGWYRFQGSWGGGSTRTLLVNGAGRATVLSSGNCTIINPTTAPIQVGASGTLPLNGQVVFARLWRRALSAAELIETYDSPWSLYRPQRLYVPRGGAAPSVPTLLTASAINVTGTSFRPRVTFTR